MQAKHLLLLLLPPPPHRLQLHQLSQELEANCLHRYPAIWLRV
jgi:hypothetical protein